jgi:hypothetical protein
MTQFRATVDTRSRRLAFSTPVIAGVQAWVGALIQSITNHPNPPSSGEQLKSSLIKLEGVLWAENRVAFGNCAALGESLARSIRPQSFPTCGHLSLEAFVAVLPSTPLYKVGGIDTVSIHRVRTPVVSAPRRRSITPAPARSEKNAYAWSPAIAIITIWPVVPIW